MDRRWEDTKPSSPSSSSRPLPPSNVYSRIYIPSQYKSKNRTSSCSTRSFESLPEGEQANFKPQQYSFPSQSLQHPQPHKHHRRHSEQSKYTSYKKERVEKRWRAILELLETERSYVKDLDLIWNFFIQPLKQSGDDLLLSQLFPHFQHILNTNKELLRSLECAVLPGLPPIPAQTTTVTNATTVTTFNSLNASTTVAEAIHPASPSWSSTDSNSHRDSYLKTRASIQLAPSLLNLVPFLKLYTPFIRNFENSQQQLNKLQRAKPEFGSFIRNAQYTIVDTGQGGFEWTRLGLNSKLLAIVQRVPRYKLLISQILKYTDEAKEEFVNLQRALRLVSDVANTFETHIAQYQHTMSLLTLQKSIFGVPFPIVAPGRTHIKSGWLVKIGRKREEVKAFFLLNDCLIYASPTCSSVGSVMNVVNPTSPPSTPSITEFKNSPFGSAPPLRSSSKHNSSHRLSSLAFPASPATAERPQVKSAGRRGHKHSASLPVNMITQPHSLSASVTNEEDGVPSVSTPPRLVGPIDIGTLKGQCFTFNRKLDLEDVTVVAIDNDYPQLHGRTIQVISSEKSFSIYAESEEERNAWLNAIRSTKDEYLSAFRTLKIDDNQFPLDPDTYIRRKGNSTNTTVKRTLNSPALSFSTPFSGHSTPTSKLADENGSHRQRRRSVHAYAEVPTSQSKSRPRERTRSALTGDISAAAAATAIVNGLRWKKQAKEKDGEGEGEKEERADGSILTPSQSYANSHSHSNPLETKLRVLEHYAAPVWVPDSKAVVCMSCSEPFNWMRRKHHCRMCGHVVCHECSTRNFLIVNEAGEHQPSRACDDCYDTAFPSSSGGEETEEEMEDDNATTQARCQDSGVGGREVDASTRSTSSTSLNGVIQRREPSLTRSSYATSSSSIGTSAPSSPTCAQSGQIGQIGLHPPPPPPPPSQSQSQSPKMHGSHAYLTASHEKSLVGTANMNSGFNPSQSVVTCTSAKPTESAARLGVGRRNLAAPRITTPKAGQASRRK
ncbi:hypothetical protein E3P86_01066 [Wallemia ichthyophaga]|uniref:FYVE, RhoGEF and PH domain-containing protein 6 n=1 Tax=Wallemia ichthyophaga TaxID=245174 RepID=A0A4T0J9U8_WALIC|nr:hypothetical protein E3P86_01066 [Wallemia ichthyophaga]